MSTEPMNSAIICVDDEEGIIEAYKNTLGQKNAPSIIQGRLSDRRQRRKGVTQDHSSVNRNSIQYDIFTATSGEEAVKIVRTELEAGRQFCAGFFDMSMPGGIDGQETIKRILELDNQILCAIVTAYTDRSPEQLGELFTRQDNWLYFNKPFSSGELQQTAYHMVTSWNRRRREESLISNLEMMRQGLVCILDSVNNINRIPPLMLHSLLEGILKHFLGLLNCQNGFVKLMGNDKIPYAIGTGDYYDGNEPENPPDSDEWQLVLEALKQKKSIVRNNQAASPMKIGEETLGVLFVKSDLPITQDTNLLDMYATQAVNMIRNSKLFDELEKRNLELNKKNQELVDLVGQLTHTEKLKKEYEEMSYVDALTGLANRRYVEIRFAEELSRSKRYNFSMACLLMDVDHFKVVNDTYGHPAGDEVLRELGLILGDSKRAFDVVGRFGGEEFVMIFKQIDIKDTLMVCDRIRTSVANKEILWEGNILKITISIGVAALIPGKNETVESILKQADAALYQAKESGRNRCVLYRAE